MAEGEAREEVPAQPEEVNRKSSWDSFKDFLTQGNARWQTLGLVLMIGAIVGVVTTNPAAVNGLRQNLLLKNHANQQHAEEHKIRAALSGVDPQHHYWDDVKAMRRGQQQQMQLPGTQEPRFVAAQPQPVRSPPRIRREDRIRNGCMQACAANGYSAVTAGSTATKACVDVCLEEKGVRPVVAAPSAPHVNALSARAMQTLRSRSISSRGRDAQPSPPMAAAQRLLARLQSGASGQGAELSHGAKSLGAAMKALGVDPHKMSQAEGEALTKGVKMDRVIGEREGKTGAALRREWKDAQKTMLTVEAALLTNAKNLATAAAKAEQQNLAKEKLEQSLVDAAQNYAQAVGSESNLPVNAASAQKQLVAAKRNDAKLRAAARTAHDIYGEEQELWANARPLTAKQLAEAHWVMPGQATQEEQWSQALDGAAVMSKEEGKAVRLAAMSNGKLLGMEKAAYEKNKASTERMAKHLKDLEAARVANAEMVHTAMAKAAKKKAAEAQLLQAENRFVSAGGKLGPQAILTSSISPKALAANVQQDTEEVQALQLAARGADGMVKQYGEQLKDGVGSLVADSQPEEHKAAPPAAPKDDSILGGLVRGFKAVTGTAEGSKQGGEEQGKQTARQGSRGEAGVEAVDKASKGWFHLW